MPRAEKWIGPDRRTHPERRHYPAHYVEVELVDSRPREWVGIVIAGAASLEDAKAQAMSAFDLPGYAVSYGLEIRQAAYQVTGNVVAIPQGKVKGGGDIGLI